MKLLVWLTWKNKVNIRNIPEYELARLREKAKDVLGDKFDIKKFHTIVLDQGIVPLFILEDIINEWIESF